MCCKLSRTENICCFLAACLCACLMLWIADLIVGESLQDMANAVAYREAVRERTIHRIPVDDLLADLNLCQSVQAVENN